MCRRLCFAYLTLELALPRSCDARYIGSGMHRYGASAHEEECEHQGRNEDGSTERRDLDFAQWIDAAARRREDHATDDQQHAYRPFQRARLAKIADECLIPLNPTANEQRSSACHEHQGECLEIVVLQDQ